MLVLCGLVDKALKILDSRDLTILVEFVHQFFREFIFIL